MTKQLKVLIVFSGNIQGGNPFTKEQAQSLKNEGVEIDFFLIKKKGILGYLKSLPALKKKIKSFAPDIVHAHHGFSGVLAVLQRKVPVVVTFHGNDINYKKEQIIAIFANLFAKWRIFVSKSLFKNSLIKFKNSSIIPCGIDLKIFFPIEKNHARTLLKLDPNKKYALFSSAFSRRVKNYPLAKKVLSNFKDVELIELKDKTRNEVNLFLNAVDFLILTSFNEGSPQIIKEAMACNCPIIATDIADIKKVIKNTEGCFVTSFNQTEIIKAITSILQYNKKTNGRENIKEFDLQLIAKRILNVYNKVLNKNENIN